MKQIFKGVILTLCTLLIPACSTVNHSSQRPSWIDNPGKGVSVSAGMHVGGRVAQEELAILRGRTEFAKRLGVNIQSEQISATSVNNEKSSTVGTQLTHEETKQKDIKVLVVEKWREPETDVLWILLVPTEK